MDFFARDRKTSKDDKNMKQSVGSLICSQGNSGGLRRPHGASTASQSSIKSDSSMTSVTSTGHLVCSQDDSGGLRRPHGASTASQSSIKSDSSMTSVTSTGHLVCSQDDSGGLRRPHGASTASQSSIKSDSSMTSVTSTGHLVCSQDDSGGLRRPHGASTASQSSIKSDSSTTSVTTHNEEEKKFVLSPEAAEFVPRVTYSSTFPKENEKKQVYEESVPYLKYLTNFFNILTMNPEKFTDLVPPFIKKLRLSNSMRNLRLFLATMIEFSISENDFRCNGARLCDYFDTVLEKPKGQYISKYMFRESLSFKLTREVQLLEWLNKPEEERDHWRCNQLILFLAELVVHMDEAYAFTLGELLIILITMVVQRPALDSVKYIIQALKVAGPILEKDKSRNDVANMMRALAKLVNDKYSEERARNTEGLGKEHIQ